MFVRCSLCLLFQYAQSYTAQESYDDAYTRRDPYAEEQYQEPVSAAG
jgi:hypothetical protein